MWPSDTNEVGSVQRIVHPLASSTCPVIVRLGSGPRDSVIAQNTPATLKSASAVVKATPAICERNLISIMPYLVEFLAFGVPIETCKYHELNGTRACLIFVRFSATVPTLITSFYPPVARGVPKTVIPENDAFTVICATDTSSVAA